MTPAIKFYQEVLKHKDTVAFPLYASMDEDVVTLQTEINTLKIKFAPRIVEVWDHRDNLQCEIEFEPINLFFADNCLFVNDSNTTINLV